MNGSGRPTVTRSIEVDAAPAAVWELVSDLPRMGELSPENRGGSWLRGATGPVLGARFRGANRRGWRRWSTTVQVTACEPGRTFAFDVSSLGLSVSRWTYDVTPRDAGRCTVSETWQDRRGRLMDAIGLAATGVGDRETYTARSIEHTLARLKERAETGG
jgi:hypothetical protein